MGNVITVQNALGNSTLYECDNNRNLKKVTIPKERIISYTYDFWNNVHAFTDARNNTVTYYYDPNGNRTQYDYSNNVEVTYSYDEINRLEVAVDASVNRTE